MPLFSCHHLFWPGMAVLQKVSLSGFFLPHKETESLVDSQTKNQRTAFRCPGLKKLNGCGAVCDWFIILVFRSRPQSALEKTSFNDVKRFVPGMAVKSVSRLFDSPGKLESWGYQQEL